MIDILERTVQKHSNTTFIACHFANLDYDLERLGQTARKTPQFVCRYCRAICGNSAHSPICREVLREACRSFALRH